MWQLFIAFAIICWSLRWLLKKHKQDEVKNPWRGNTAFHGFHDHLPRLGRFNREARRNSRIRNGNKTERESIQNKWKQEPKHGLVHRLTNFTSETGFDPRDSDSLADREIMVRSGTEHKFRWVVKDGKDGAQGTAKPHREPKWHPYRDQFKHLNQGGKK